MGYQFNIERLIAALKRHRYNLALFLFVSITAMVIHRSLAINYNQMLVDENHHFRQILIFLQGRFRLFPSVTVIPGYHAILAFIAQITNLKSLVDARLFSLLFGIGSVFTFHRCAVKLVPEAARQRTLDYFLMPIFFPYLFLVYTHSLSMLFILLGINCHLNKRKILAALFLGFSVLIRQTNIVWVTMFFIMNLLEDGSLKINFSLFHRERRANLLYSFIIGAAILFFIWNKGVAVGDLTKHPLQLKIENIFYSLFIFAVLFMPFIVANLKSMVGLLKTKTLIIAAIILSSGFIYLYFFTVSHPYNLYDHFAHNIIPKYFVSRPAIKMLSFIPMFFALLSLAVFKLKSKSQYLLYPFWFISLLFLSLIEHRYYIPIISMFLLFKRPEDKFAEWTLTFNFLILSVGICASWTALNIFP